MTQSHIDTYVFTQIGQKVFNKLLVFVSIDLINSTKYKHDNLHGHIQEAQKIDEIQMSFTKTIPDMTLWKMIGDELVFLRIYDEESIKKLVSDLDKTVQFIEDKNKYDQSMPLKATAWALRLLAQEEWENIIASWENDENANPSIMELLNEDNDTALIVKLNEGLKSQSTTDMLSVIGQKKALAPKKLAHRDIITSIDFIGKPMDIGFRISKFAKENLLLISHELFIELENSYKVLDINADVESKAFIQNFVSLKGIFKGDPYPIILWNDNKGRIEEFVSRQIQNILMESKDFLDHHTYTTENNQAKHALLKKYYPSKYNG
jgi:hypothetical protein